MDEPRQPPGRDTPFAPPGETQEVCCIHCGRSYDSSEIRWVPRPSAHGEPDEHFTGDWCCPTPGCGGVGYCFDIWPTDPHATDEEGNAYFSFDDASDDDEDAADWWKADADEEDEDASPLHDTRGPTGNPNALWVDYRPPDPADKSVGNRPRPEFEDPDAFDDNDIPF